MERFIWKRHKDIFKGVGIYHITFVVNGRQRLLGELAIDHEELRCLPSDLGRAISHDLDEIQQRRPYVRLLAKQLMPAANQWSSSMLPLSVPVLRSLTALPRCPMHCSVNRVNTSLAMNDSSFIISPVSADFSDVWSEPQLLSAKGHNAIYAATRFGRKYILKALAEPYRQSTPHVELLRKEFTIGVGVDHPNIVRLLDFGRMNSIGWYIRMEYIDGITLEQFLETNPPAVIRRRVIEQLLDALSCLHERQIIHRDIKPSNILITRNGSTVKLIDFGVSDTDDYVTFKQPAGSMAYIAPEQLAGKPIDNRADIYSVGKIIALLFPHRYRCIARRCTRTNSADRYSSCAQVLRAIRRIDRVRIWLPVSLLLSVVLCLAGWLMYAEYRHAEIKHSEQEQSLSANIDSLLKVNDERQAKVDSLNRVVDALAVKANTPSPREVVRKKAADIHFARHTAIRKAVKNGELKTMTDVRDYDGGMKECLEEAKRSIKDPILYEEFMHAFMEYWNMNDPLYDSLALVLPEK